MSRLDDAEVEAIRERHRIVMTEGLIFGPSYVDVGMLLADRDVLVAELDALRVAVMEEWGWGGQALQCRRVLGVDDYDARHDVGRDAGRDGQDDESVVSPPTGLCPAEFHRYPS